MHSWSRLSFLIAALAIASAGSADPAQAADIFWTVTPGIDDAEVSTEGDLVFGYYFNPDTARPVTVTVNTVPFERQSTGTAPAGLQYNGSYNNPENVDLYQVPLDTNNAGLDQILDGQNWGSEAPLTLTGLVPDGLYTVQFMISDDRSGFLNARNYDVSDANDVEGFRDLERVYHSTRGAGVPLAAPIGSMEGKIFTGQFYADVTGTQDIRNWLYEGLDHLGDNAGSQVNAIQLRIVPEPGTMTLACLAFALYGLQRHWTKRSRKERLTL
jgi:hypothetical protein